MPESAPKTQRRTWPLGAGLAMAVGAGVVASLFAAVVLLVTRAAFSFLDRVDLVEGVAMAKWEDRVVWLLALAVVAIVIRAGAVLTSDTPEVRKWGAILVGLGLGLVLAASPFWPAAAVGAGWGIGIGRNLQEIGVATGIGIVVALFGFTTDVATLLEATVQGILAAAIVALLITIAALAHDRLSGARQQA